MNSEEVAINEAEQVLSPELEACKAHLIGHRARGACWSCTAAVNKKNGVSKYVKNDKGKLLKTKPRGGQKIINDKGGYIRALAREFVISKVRFSVNGQKVRVEGLCETCKESNISAFIKQKSFSLDMEVQADAAVAEPAVEGRN